MTKVLIAGGGIAGPVTAMAMKKAGFEPVVFEAYDRSAEGVGAFLTLAVNGLTALRELDLLDLVRHQGFDTPRFVFHSGTGRRLGELANGITLRGGLVSQTVRRADLYQPLRAEADRRGVRVEYGKRLVDAEVRGDGVVARFADGTEAHGDLLVGADGLRSRTRTIIDPNAPRARYTGLLNSGGYARGVKVDAEPGVMNMIFGKKAFFAYLVAPDGEVWWFANPPSERELGREELAAITDADWRARLHDLFDVDSGPAPRLIDATEEIFAGWSTYDFPTVPTWRNDRMVIIGDAAHATSPAAGQGASMAIEDAVVLAKCLRDVGDVPRALAAYEGLRRERVERVVAVGKRNGDQKAVGPVARVARDLMMPLFLKRMNKEVGSSHRWMYDHPLDWDRTVAA